MLSSPVCKGDMYWAQGKNTGKQDDSFFPYAANGLVSTTNINQGIVIYFAKNFSRRIKGHTRNYIKGI